MFPPKTRTSSVWKLQVILFSCFIVSGRVLSLAYPEVWANEVDIFAPNNEVRVEFACKVNADLGTVKYTLYDTDGVKLDRGSLKDCDEEISFGLASETITYKSKDEILTGLSVCIESSEVGFLQFLSFGLTVGYPEKSDEGPQSACDGMDPERITLVDESDVAGFTIRLVGEGDEYMFFDWIYSINGRGNIGNFPNVNQLLEKTSREPSSPPTSPPTMMPSSAPSSAPTNMPSSVPTDMPSSAPTAVPSLMPTSVPSLAPTPVASMPPTNIASAQPTAMPSTVECLECQAALLPAKDELRPEFDKISLQVDIIGAFLDEPDINTLDPVIAGLIKDCSTICKRNTDNRAINRACDPMCYTLVRDGLKNVRRSCSINQFCN